MDNSIYWQLEHYPTLPSTNDYCIEQARLGKKTNLAVLADSQTQPRGSRGRQWIEPKGNLAFSLLYYPSFSASKMVWVSFVASLSIYDAIIDLCGPQNKLCIKWPNDLLYQHKKLGGILIESHIEPPNQLKWFVIGFGMNIYSKPDLSDRRVACLYDFLEKCPTPDLLSTKIREYFNYWLEYITHDKESEIRKAWLQRSMKIGDPLTVTIKNQKWEGVYNGINTNGFLLLKINDQIKTFSTGEVFCSDTGRKD